MESLIRKIRNLKRLISTSGLVLNASPEAIVKIGKSTDFLGGEINCFGSARVVIGHHCWFSTGLQIVSAVEVKIGDFFICGRNVHISDTNEHPLDPLIRRQQTIDLLDHQVTPDRSVCDSSPVSIGKDVWVGERAIILKGVSIGDGAVVAAGSIVTKSVPKNTVVAGNPARVVKEISEVK